MLYRYIFKSELFIFSEGSYMRRIIMTNQNSTLADNLNPSNRLDRPHTSHVRSHVATLKSRRRKEDLKQKYL